MLLASARRRSRTRPPISRRTFTSQRESDPESALMHYRARSYDPRTGRFAQNEPLLSLKPKQHHTYSRNRPVDRVDPTGLFVPSVHREVTNALPGYGNFALEEIIESNHAQDKGAASEIPENHFDDNRVAESIALIKSRLDIVSDPAKTKTLVEARATFGQVLHAIGDFYAHSNYVERWLYDRGAISPSGPAFGEESVIKKIAAGGTTAIPHFRFEENLYRLGTGEQGVAFKGIAIQTGIVKGSGSTTLPTHRQVNKDGIPALVRGAAATGRFVGSVVGFPLGYQVDVAQSTVGGAGHSQWVTSDNVTLHDLAKAAAKKHMKPAHESFVEALKKNRNFNAATVGDQVLKTPDDAPPRR